MDVIMITGDYAETAEAVATKVGIYKKGDKILTGGELEKMSEKELNKILPKVSVFARVSPEHKFKIIVC